MNKNIDLSKNTQTILLDVMTTIVERSFFATNFVKKKMNA